MYASCWYYDKKFFYYAIRMTYFLNLITINNLLFLHLYYIFTWNQHFSFSFNSNNYLRSIEITQFNMQTYLFILIRSATPAMEASCGLKIRVSTSKLGIENRANSRSPASTSEFPILCHSVNGRNRCRSYQSRRSTATKVFMRVVARLVFFIIC